MIASTIDCLIMNAIFPPLGTAGREGETARGDGETGNEQRKRREEREGDFVSYTIAEEML